MSLTKEPTTPSNPTPPGLPASALPVVRPRVDLFAGEEALLVLAELPGVSAENLTIHLDERVLRIEATGHTGPVAEGSGATHAAAVRYERAFTLRADVDGDQIHASLRDGLLELRLPRAEATRSRRIPISA